MTKRIIVHGVPNASAGICFPVECGIIVARGRGEGAVTWHSQNGWRKGGLRCTPSSPYELTFTFYLWFYRHHHNAFASKPTACMNVGGEIGPPIYLVEALRFQTW